MVYSLEEHNAFVVITLGLGLLLVHLLGRTGLTYYLKMFIYYLSLLIVSSISVPYMLMKSGDVEAMVFPSRLMCCVSSALGLRWKVLDFDTNWPTNAPAAVMVVNHQCSLDLLGIFTLWPMVRKMTIVAKASLKYLASFGFVAYLAGIVFIERSKGKLGHQIIQAALEECKKSGTTMVIFPEGTRSHHRHHRTMLPFKKGAFVAAIKAQVPIVPVVFSHYDFLDKNQKVLEPSVVRIHVLPPIPTEGMSDVATDSLAEEVRQRMLDVLRADDDTSSTSVGC